VRCVVGYVMHMTHTIILLLPPCMHLQVAITRFVVRVMAERYVQPPVVYFSSIYKQSTASTPIVFVLSPGAWCFCTQFDFNLFHVG